MLGHFS